MLQRFFDTLIFMFVEIWMIVQRPAVYFRLARRQKQLGFWRTHIAVPRFATEKFFWRKVIDHNPLFETVTDKAAAKEWIASQGFDVALPETYWVGTDAHEIPDEIWAKPSYMKATHGWQMNIPVLTPPEDRASVIEELNSFIGQSHTLYYGEWAYINLPHRLIAEQALGLEHPLIEAKCYTYGPIIEQIIVIRNGDERTATRWIRNGEGVLEVSDFRTAISPTVDGLPLPPKIVAAMNTVSDIASHFDHIRVDLMLDGDDLYLGELTVYNLGGQVHMNPDKLHDFQNRSWDLRRTWFLTAKHKGWRRLYAAALRRALDRRSFN